MKSHLSDFDILVISDIHFGNGRVSPIRTYERLQQQLYPLMEKIKLLIICGDTFDTLLNMNSDAGWYVAKFIDDVIVLAQHYGVYVRVVRGTFSHDRHQNRFFTVKNRGELKLNDKPLVRVLDRISVEHFDEMNINVMYCPDDQPHQDMNQAVIDVIKANHLETVDLLCSHGYYEHLLPPGIPHIPHNTLAYSKLNKYVSGMMVNGHVHRANVFENKVISIGSFERFEFGNELPVGMWMLHVKNEKNKRIWTYEFLENNHSLIFKTFVTAKYNTPESMCEDITRFMEERPESDEPTYVRIMGDVIEGVSGWIKDTFDRVIVSDKRTTTVQPVLEEEIRVDTTELPIITEDNLPKMVFDKLPEDAGMTYEEVEKIINEL
jgi:hypothetical protein